MLSRLKSLLVGQGETEFAAADPSADERAVALGVLMIIAAKGDGVFDDAEVGAVKRRLAETFSLSETDVAEVLEMAIQGERDAIDVYSHARRLTANLDYDERVGILDQLFHVIGADGESAHDEEERIFKIANSMGIRAADFGAARARARRG